MRWPLILLNLIILTASIKGQNKPPDYSVFIKKADSLYHQKEYKKAAITYSEGFKTMGWKGKQNDRYNAACSWALAGEPDSAFFQLDNVATKANYADYKHINTDPDLNSLHSDKRWAPILEIIKQNKIREEANKPLITALDTIYTEDQKYRQQVEEIQQKYGRDSKEVQSHWKLINEKDSINLIKVRNILDKYGWPGTDVVGQQGSITVFLVIQHADLATQEKYLPLMREAVKNGKAQAGNLGLLEDRVALRQGKKQIYGSQIGWDPTSKKYYVSPLEDPDNVDERRAKIGLQPLSEYVSRWQIKWDVEQYKKDLPAIEAREKS